MRKRCVMLAAIVLLALPVAAQADTWWEWLIRKLIESSGGWWGY